MSAEAWGKLRAFSYSGDKMTYDPMTLDRHPIRIPSDDPCKDHSERYLRPRLLAEVEHTARLLEQATARHNEAKWVCETFESRLAYLKRDNPDYGKSLT